MSEELTRTNQRMIERVAAHFGMSHSEAVNFCLASASHLMPSSRVATTSPDDTDRSRMKASRLFTMFDDQPDAKVFVDVNGHLIPVIGAEYHDTPPERAVILRIDPFELITKIEKARADRETRT